MRRDWLKSCLLRGNIKLEYETWCLCCKERVYAACSTGVIGTPHHAKSSVRASNLVHFGCPGELFWLVKQLRTCLTYASSFSLLAMPPPKREYNAISTIAMKFGNTVWVKTSRYFDKDHATADREDSCSQAYDFATATIYSWWQSSEIGCVYRI